jgi:serine/threonine-protein kinase
LDQIVLKALAKDRNLRYSTASEFLADLEAAKHGRKVSAPPLAPVADDATQVLAPTALPLAVAAATTPSFQANGILPDQDELDAEEEEAAAKKKRIIIIAVIGGIALVILGVLAYLMLSGDTPDNTPSASSTLSATVEVPPVPDSGDEDAAKEALEKAHFKPVRAEEPSDTVEAGKVTRFDPESGTKQKRGSEVTYYVSLGSSEVKVPDVKGKDQTEARKLLTDAGLKVVATTSTVDSPDVEKDLVVGTDPEKDTSVPRDSEVTLLISTGMTTVPDCTGKSQETCEADLETAGLRLGSVQTEVSDKEAGTVLGQDPGSGQKAAQGARVNVTVAEAPAEKTIPDYLVGQTEANAKKILQDNGLVAEVVKEASATVAAGTVIRTDPAPGEKVPEGSTVKLIISTGPGASPSVSPSP